MAGRHREAEEAGHRYRTLFGTDNFFLELQNNSVYGDVRRNHLLAELAGHLGLGIVATGNVHYHRRERHRLQDVLVAIRTVQTLDGSHRQRRENSEYFLRPPGEMAERFRDFPEAVANTRRIAERCTFDLTRDLDYQFPTYPVPGSETQDSYLRKVCYQEVGRRYRRVTPEVKARIEEELRLIEKQGLSGFFLIHREILQLAHEVVGEVRGRPAHGPPGRGRGSSVGSIICYLIGLSHIDPIANNLFLGRFLNEDLASIPDIDLDFPRDIREKLMLRMYQHFGHEHTGLVATFPTYKIRSAIREVGKAFGLQPAELDRLAKTSEGGSARHIRDEMGRLESFRRRLGSGVWRQFAEIVEEIAGFPRHISQHVGGMVISSRPLIEIVPMEQSAMDGRILIQWDKDSVDDARMIKIDFLALGMLSAQDECLQLIEEQHGKRIDLSRIDFKDQRVYDSISAADTMGVFQIESRAQMQTLPRVKPQSLEDLTVQVAIIRPGPVVGGSVNPYIARRMRKEPVVFDDPCLEPVLGETLGVILYQEQMLQVAMALAGFTAGQAESLRRAMSRKRSKEAMLKHREAFMDGCLARGVSHEVAERVFTKITAFAAFGFPKAHAAAFGLLAYQTAWLRHYFPSEYLCALFNAQPMGFYTPHVLVNDGKRHGVEVLPPDINLSGADCTMEGDAVRIGLRYVKGLSETTAQEVQDERERGGPFRSLFDFLERTRLKREQVENLVACGCFDSFGLERRELLWQLGLVYRPEGRNAKHRQIALPLPVDQDMPTQAGFALKPTTEWEKIRADYMVLGMSPRHHPLSFLRPRLHEGVVPTRMIDSLADGTPVEVAGLVVCRQRPGTAKGFVFMVLEDEFGLVNVIVKPHLYERARATVRTEPFLVVKGELQRRDGITNLVAKSLVPFSAGDLAPQAHNFG
jgi:error-prone DNA polymerase